MRAVLVKPAVTPSSPVPTAKDSQAAPLEGRSQSGQGKHAAFIDNSPRMVAQAKREAELFGAPAQPKLASMIDGSPRLAAQAQRKAAIFGPLVQPKAPPHHLPHAPEEDETYQLKATPNRTGLPDNLKAGVEALSGMSLDHVRVHRNSDKPAQLNALAYAQGSDIHVAPVQEKHLPHEAWHVVQQAQGRVKPTMQMKGGVPVNDDAGLENEANVMGAKAAVVGQSAFPSPLSQVQAERAEDHPQRSRTSGQGEKGPLNFLSSDPANVSYRLTDRIASSPAASVQRPHFRNVPGDSVGRGREPVARSLGVVQCLVIEAAQIALPADFDTANYAACEQQLNTLADGYRVSELRRIERMLNEGGARSGLLENPTNDERLLRLTMRLIKQGPSVPDKSPMGYFEKRTAATQVENQPVVNPLLRPLINIWVIGDRQRGIVWGAIGNHLRGRIDDDGYRELGIQCSLLLPPLQQQQIEAQAEPEYYVDLAQQAFIAACADLRNGLGQLPNFNGTSYRQSGVANRSVYSSMIVTNDHIMDRAFWSTSIFRGAGGAAGTWTDFGSVDHPVVYFVIHGITGKYIARYAQTEGEREVLFHDRTVFQVTRIVNLKNRTFFVYVSEVPPPLPGVTIKDPFTGNIY